MMVIPRKTGIPSVDGQQWDGWELPAAWSIPRSVSIPGGSMALEHGSPLSLQHWDRQESGLAAIPSQEGSLGEQLRLEGSPAHGIEANTAGQGRAEVVCRLAWSIPGAFPVFPSPSRQLPISPVQALAPSAACATSPAKAIPAREPCLAWGFCFDCFRKGVWGLKREDRWR